MKKTLITLIGLAALSLAGVQAQILINSSNFTYSQNFDTLATSGTTNTWTDNSTIPGWYSNRVVYIGTNGSSTTGGLNSLGATSSTDRALGATSSSGASTVNFGMILQNASGFSINLSDISVSYTGEMWRQNAAAQSLVFAYLISPTTLPLITASGYTANTSLNFSSPVSGTAAATDGNSSANKSVLSNVALDSAGILNNGDYLAIRWTKTTSNSPSLGIDDFTVSANAVPEPSTWILIGISSAFLLWRIRRKNSAV